MAKYKVKKVKAKRLKEIKTIYVARYTPQDAERFDALVNEHISKGWRIGYTRVIEAQGNNSIDVFYALLEKWEV